MSNPSRLTGCFHAALSSSGLSKAEQKKMAAEAESKYAAYLKEAAGGSADMAQADLEAIKDIEQKLMLGRVALDEGVQADKLAEAVADIGRGDYAKAPVPASLRDFLKQVAERATVAQDLERLEDAADHIVTETYKQFHKSVLAKIERTKAKKTKAAPKNTSEKTGNAEIDQAQELASKEPLNADNQRPVAAELGESHEPVHPADDTAAEIKANLTKGAKADKISPKEAGRELLAQIDAAMVNTPTLKEKSVYWGLGVNSRGKSDADTKETIRWAVYENPASKQKVNINAQLTPDEIAQHIGYITIDVPGDGRYKLLNTQETLKAFRDRAAKSIGFGGANKIPMVEPQNRAHSKPETSSRQASALRMAKEFAGEDNRQAALDAAELGGVQVAFAIRHNASPLLMVDIEPVEIEQDVSTVSGQTFIPYSKTGSGWVWQVIELETGLRVGEGSSRPDAIKNAREKTKQSTVSLADSIKGKPQPGQDQLRKDYLADTEEVSGIEEETQPQPEDQVKENPETLTKGEVKVKVEEEPQNPKLADLGKKLGEVRRRYDFQPLTASSDRQLASRYLTALQESGLGKKIAETVIDGAKLLQAQNANGRMAYLNPSYVFQEAKGYFEETFQLKQEQPSDASTQDGTRTTEASNPAQEDDGNKEFFSKASRAAVEALALLAQENPGISQTPIIPESVKSMEGIAKGIDADIKITSQTLHPEGHKPVRSWIVRLPPKRGQFISNSYGKIYQLPNGNIYTDVSTLSPGDSGNKIYVIAGNFAYNNGVKFIGDPNGLSDMAIVRRTENMLSLAAKFGTTSFLYPHPRQDIQWADGDDEGNFARLLDKSQENILVGNRKAGFHGVPELNSVEYNFETRRFEVMPSGREFTDKDFDDLAKKANERNHDRRILRQPGLSGTAGEGEAKVGSQTLKRSALVSTLVRAAGEGGWGDVLGLLAQQPNQHVALKKILYSRQSGASSTESGSGDPAASLAQGWADQLGVTPPAVVVDGNVNAQAVYKGGTIRISPSVAAYLSSPNPLVRGYGMEVVAHEFGHYVADTLLADADEKTRSAIERDYNRWVKDQRDRNLGQSLASRMTAARGRLEGSASDAELARAGITQEYVMSIHEWLADNAARILLGQKASGVTHPATRNLIQRIAALLKKLWRALTGSYDTDMPSPSMERFLQGLVDAHQGRRSGLLTALEKEYPDGLPLDGSEPAYSKAGESYSLTSQFGDIQSKLANQLANFQEPSVRTFNALDKTVHTQLWKAEKSPEFRRVFDSSIAYELDLARMANESADHAPLILPKLTPMDVLNGTLNVKQGAVLGSARRAYRRAQDMKGIANAIFETTLAKKKMTAQELSAYTPQQQTLYRQFFDAVNHSLDELAKSEMYRAARVLHLTPAPEDYDVTNTANFYYDQVTAPVMAQIADVTRLWADRQRDIRALRASAKALPGIAQYIRDEARERAKIALKEKNDAIKELLAELRTFKEERKAFVNKAAHIERMKREGYAPLMRFGDYTVDAVVTHVNPVTSESKEERIFYGHYDTEAQAKQMARDLAEEYPDAEITRGVNSQQSWRMFNGVTPETMESFAKAINLEQEEAFQQYLKMAVGNRSALKRLIKRKGIAGFSEDIPRVLASFITSNARLSAKNYHLGEMIGAIQDIPKQKGDVADEAVKLYDYVQNPQEAGVLVRNALFAWYLGGSVASAAVNLTQTLTMTLPTLSRYGTRNAAQAITKAMKQALREKQLPADELGALRRADGEGVTAPHELHMLHSASNRTGFSKVFGWMRPLGVAWGAFFSAAESYNRRVAFLAAYQLAKQAHEADPFAKAVETVNQTQGVYSKSNRPNAARGTVGQAVFTFKMFSIIYTEMLAKLPSKERNIALFVLILLAGVDGLPFAEDLQDMIDTLAQSLGYNLQSKQWKHEFVGKMLGETKRDMLLYGLTSQTPFDLSQRLGVSNLVPGTSLLKKSESRDQRTRDLLEFTGPTGSLVQRGLEAFDAASGRGTLAGKAKAIAQAGLPLAVSNAVQGAEMLATGKYTDMRGRKVEDVSTTHGIGKALGFQPANVAARRRVEGFANRGKEMASAVRDDVIELWARGKVEGDHDKIAEAKAMMADWNRKNPEWKILVPWDTVNKRTKAMSQSSAERIKKSTPKAWRKTVMELENEK